MLKKLRLGPVHIERVELEDNVGGIFDSENIVSGNAVLTNPANRIWNTVIIVIRIAAFAGIFITGARYMFASADQKADLKKGLVPLVIGCVFVFSSTILIEFVVGIFSSTTSSIPNEANPTLSADEGAEEVVENFDEFRWVRADGLLNIFEEPVSGARVVSTVSNYDVVKVKNLRANGYCEVILQPGTGAATDSAITGFVKKQFLTKDTRWNITGTCTRDTEMVLADQPVENNEFRVVQLPAGAALVGNFFAIMSGEELWGDLIATEDRSILIVDRMRKMYRRVIWVQSPNGDGVAGWIEMF